MPEQGKSTAFEHTAWSLTYYLVLRTGYVHVSDVSKVRLYSRIYRPFLRSSYLEFGLFVQSLILWNTISQNIGMLVTAAVIAIENIFECVINTYSRPIYHNALVS